MRIVHQFRNPERFIVGTVGQPGERTFFLQAKEGARVVAVSLEKTQVAALAERALELIPSNTVGVIDDGPLETPVTEEFRAGVIAIAWDINEQTLMIEAQAQSDDEEIVEGDDGPDVLRVVLEADRAWSFAQRARVVVAAGRQPCPYCSLPLDPSGHICPRANGYRR